MIEKQKHSVNKMYKKPTWAFYYAPRVQEALVEIRQLIDFCNMNKIQCTLPSF